MSNSYARSERAMDSIVATLAQRAARGFRTLRAWHEARVAARLLHAMSDGDLKDIGISRADIEFMVRRRDCDHG
jgi:uncharacterized protein YjiS (DUF1127 family)